MNASAAVLAASIRVGATSVAAMLPETSNARMTVPSRRGTPMTLCGRASEKTRIVTPRRVRTAGMRRVHRLRRRRRRRPPPPRRPRRHPAPAEPRHPLRPPPLPRQVQQHPDRDRQEEQQERWPDERHGATASTASGARPSGRSPRPGPRRSRARPRRPRRAGTRPPAPPRALAPAAANRRRNFGSCVSM